MKLPYLFSWWNKGFHSSTVSSWQHHLTHHSSVEPQWFDSEADQPLMAEIYRQLRHLVELCYILTTWPSSAADSHSSANQIAALCNSQYKKSVSYRYVNYVHRHIRYQALKFINRFDSNSALKLNCAIENFKIKIVIICWHDFNWHSASRGPSAIAELLVTIYIK